MAELIPEKETTQESAGCFLRPDELPIEEKYYKPDLEVSDRFQAYSGELLRVSLAGIVAVGFFYEKLHEYLAFRQQIILDLTVRTILNGCLVFLAVSAACALLHRSLSTDSILRHVTYIRLMCAAESEADGKRKKCLSDRADTERKWRNKLFKMCEVLLIASASALAIGAFCLVLGFAYGLK